MTDNIKDYILRYFSDELEQDQSLGAKMERAQLKKWLLDWAGGKGCEENTEKCMQYVQTGGGWARIDE